MEAYIKMMYGKKEHIDKKKYAFIHVPKTGGAGIKKSFDKYLCKSLNDEHLPTSYFDKHSHDHIFFTILRDPYDRACSEYFFIKRQINNEIVDVEPWNENTKKRFIKISEKSINDFLDSFVDENYNGSIYSYYFNSKNINDFDFVGNIQNMSESLILINNMFKINIFTSYINVNPYHNIGEPYNFLYSRKDFQKKYYKDYSIYEEGIEKFKKIYKENFSKLGGSI
jgi:hypothetical protein